MSKTAAEPAADPNTDPKAADPPAADPPKGDTPKADTPPEPKPAKQDKTFSKAEMDAAAKKAVDDAKKKWDAEKDLSDLERLRKENAELVLANRLRDARDEMIAALKAEGNRSPELAFAALKDSLAFDEKTGKLSNAKDLIESFKTTYPDQFGTEKPDTGIDAGAGQGQKGAKLTQAQLEKMTPQEIAQLPWEDVKAAMAAKQ